MNYPGDQVRITGEFRNRSTGVLTDPTTISLKVKDPQDTTTTYTYAGATITKTSTGLYYYDLTIPDDEDSEGTWHFRWVITGTLTGASEGKFKVVESEFAE